MDSIIRPEAARFFEGLVIVGIASFIIVAVVFGISFCLMYAISLAMRCGHVLPAINRSFSVAKHTVLISLLFFMAKAIFYDEWLLGKVDALGFCVSIVLIVFVYNVYNMPKTVRAFQQERAERVERNHFGSI